MGVWVRNIRKRKNKLSKNKIKQLEEINFEFIDNYNDLQWEAFFKELKEYYEERGHWVFSDLDPYFTKTGEKLHMKVANIRVRKNRLSKQKINDLKTINFIYDPLDAKFDLFLQKYEEYVKKYKTPRVLVKYKTPDGFNLGAWCSRVRNGEVKCSKENRKRLDQLGFIWKII